jgi:hypothetical protein
MRQAARESCLRTGQPGRNFAGHFKKSVFFTRTQLNVLKTKPKLQENELGDTRNEPVAIGSVANDPDTKNKKSENAERSEPNHGKIRMSCTGFKPSAKNDKFPNDPSKSHKTNDRHPPEPKIVQASQV